MTRRKMPAERDSITHKFTINTHKGYITVGKYEDGTPGEVFIKMSKEGSTVSGLMDAIAIGMSIMLQNGIPLETIVRKYELMAFEPAGHTNNKSIPTAKSIVDYIAKWLGMKFIDGYKIGADEFCHKCGSVRGDKCEVCD